MYVALLRSLKKKMFSQLWVLPLFLQRRLFLSAPGAPLYAVRTQMFDAGQKITRNILQQARGQFYNFTSVRPYKGVTSCDQ